MQLCESRVALGGTGESNIGDQTCSVSSMESTEEGGTSLLETDSSVPFVPSRGLASTRVVGVALEQPIIGPLHNKP